MRTSSTVRPGQRGAKKFLAQYGDRLVCVRYRSDEQKRKRVKTVELIVGEWPWIPRPRAIITELPGLLVRVPNASPFFDLLAKSSFGKRNFHQDDALGRPPSGS